MANKIIDSSDPGIVAKETTVHLSDEKMRSIMSRTYERAQKDAETVKFHKFYSVFLSIAGTLFMSLLTSTFNDIGSVKAATVTTWAWIVCIISALLGFVLLGVHVTDKTKNHTCERDEAVDELFEKAFSQE